MKGIRFTLGRCILGLGIVVVLFVAGTAWHYHNLLYRSLMFGGQTVILNHGDSLNSVVDQLHQRKILPDPYSLKIYARVKNLETRLKAGEYLFEDGINQYQLLDKFVKGEGMLDVKLTIVEGWTFKMMRQHIYRAPKLQFITQDWSDEKIMAVLGFPNLHPEGQFFPDTYIYRSGESDLSIFQKAFQLMQQHLVEVWQTRDPKVEISSPYEALIIASIIEKETQARDEQPQIAGVFYNRLKLGMRLQTDPSVIYGLGDAYEGNITRQHLKTDTPYNTYTRNGLTPTPISLPGLSSLIASVHPELTKALYFVSKGGGRHVFSETLEQHNAAVRKYILKK